LTVHGSHFFRRGSQTSDDLFRGIEVQHLVRGLQDQLVPRGPCCNPGVLALVVVQEEEATLDELSKQGPVDSVFEVPKAHHGGASLLAEVPLVEVPDSQIKEDVLFAFEELEELKVTVRPGIDNCRRPSAEDVLTCP